MDSSDDKEEEEEEEEEQGIKLPKMNWWFYMKCRDEASAGEEVVAGKHRIVERYDFVNRIDEDMHHHQQQQEMMVPQSPESKKKDELCSYLQLMDLSRKPDTTDEEEEERCKSRRSTRVKNQMIMNMKKKLKDKLAGSSSGNDEESEDEFRWPPFPHENVPNERVNFDEAIKEIVDEDERVAADKENEQQQRRKRFLRRLKLRKRCSRRRRIIPRNELRIFVKPKVKVKKRKKVEEEVVVKVKEEVGVVEGEEDDDDEEEDVVRVWDHDYNLSPDNKESLNGLKCRPVDKSSARSLHSNLIKRRRHLKRSTLAGVFEKSSHMIEVFEEDGRILNCIYHGNHLVVIQTYSVSFWSQSALGLVLEAQNMWIPKGNICRLPLDNVCHLVESADSVFYAEGNNSYAYVELYTKEHKSEKRERPVTDVFVVVYFWRERQKEPEKKLLQLENIASHAKHVRYVAVKSACTVLVSWWEIVSDEKCVSKLRAYQLSSDYQTVCDVRELESVECRIESLHNIEDCDNLVMGCGDQNISVWNWEFGYMVATMRIDDGILSEPQTQWVKCDQGFLFAIQHCRSSGVMRLLAVNGINESWKRLQIYKPISGFKRLMGICVDGGILVGFYENGVLCWRVQTGDLIMDETNDETIKYLPSGKHVIAYTAFTQRLSVRSALSYLITNYDSSTAGDGGGSQQASASEMPHIPPS
ncbi:PREDICTED: uncharacterized protein LOC108561574 [Nicrophorus vespilloides]|uniref:Uncharacterized protein LOC108561574 n=1 Tax=Nicrophorus vespilloides TaxID=110193 RepID=A0ABM1MKF8_NICVS|nr:PREDICTED: uncharacterized protein LOC108561574 [Nicrophorus vespilloides]XP_017775059.1 PREDICTED: uncharacterized protein LOC108561574 [Nicrophorus vespilloides]